MKLKVITCGGLVVKRKGGWRKLAGDRDAQKALGVEHLFDDASLTFDDVWGGSPKSPVVVSEFCPPDTVYVMNKKDAEKAIESEHWFNRGEKMEFEDGKRVA